MNKLHRNERMGKRRVAAALFIALVSAASILVWYAFQAQNPRADEAAITQVHPTRDEANVSSRPLGTPAPRQEAAPETGQAPAPRPMSLPDATLPLAQQLEGLEALAKAGDPEATCRLFLGLRRCHMVAQRLQRAEYMQAQLERGDESRTSEDLMVQSIAGALEQTRALSTWCKGVSAAEGSDMDALLARNILRMSSRQKVRLAMTRQDGSVIRLPRHLRGPGGLGGNTDFIYPQILSDRAYSILQEGIQHADALALEGMIMVHSPSWIPGIEEFPRLSLPNRREFVRYALLMDRVYGGDALGTFAAASLARNLASMPATQREEAQRWAEQESQRWLAVIAANPASRPDVVSASEWDRGCDDAP